MRSDVSNATLKHDLSFKMTATGLLLWHYVTHKVFFLSQVSNFRWVFFVSARGNFFTSKKTVLEQDLVVLFFYFPSFTVTRLCRWPVIFTALSCSLPASVSAAHRRHAAFQCEGRFSKTSDVIFSLAVLTRVFVLFNNPLLFLLHSLSSTTCRWDSGSVCVFCTEPLLFVFVYFIFFYQSHLCHNLNLIFLLV